MAEPLPPVSAIADVLGLHGRSGWLTPPVRPVVVPDAPRAGRALTVAIDAVESGGSLTVMHDAVSQPCPDAVIVIAAPEIAGAVWGEIMSRAARGQGAVGVVADAAVRDRVAMAREGLPVYATREGVVGPLGLGAARRAAEPVRIGTTEVAPGDVVVFDSSGAVCITAEIAEDVLADARRYAAGEDRLLEALAAGEPLTSAYRHKLGAVAAITAAITTRSPHRGDDLPGGEP